ncbi:unnamed protein product [Litomosoides sigmodontis]|uniref:Uncharacterized protein n=1 Tax=Litomosoides sigmodontis TaxID=42156 RepID=A0A3P6TZJ6_LITSI|nr:unnamed protein product [Litomosoides sigmodontis]
MNRSAHQVGYEKESDEVARATLSESLPHVYNIWDREDRSITDGRDVMSEGNKSAGKSRVRKDGTRKLEKGENSMREEGEKMPQAIIRVTSITPPIPLIGTPPMNQEEAPEMMREKNSQVEICATDDKPSLPKHDTAPVNQEAIQTKEIEKKDVECDVEEKAATAQCRNCQVMQAELAGITETVKKYEAMLEQHLAAANIKSQDIQGNSNAVATVNEEAEKWKNECDKLATTMRKLQSNTALQIANYQLKLRDVMNDREVSFSKLTKAEEKNEAFKAMLDEQRDKNYKLLSVIKKLERQSVEEVEKQRKEMTILMEKKLSKARELCRASEEKAKLFENMFSVCDMERGELYRQLSGFAENLKHVKFGEVEEESFNKQLKIKLNSLIEKFNEEAKNPNLEWMGKENIKIIVDGFTEVVKAILEKEPNLGNLAERLSCLLKGMGNAEQEPETSVKTSKEDSVEAKVFEDFKAEIRAEMESMLAEFHAKQTEEHNENICKIMSCLESTEQKVDNNVVKRMDELGNLLLAIGSKQNAIQATKERANSKMEELAGLIGNIKNWISMYNEERMAEAANFLQQKHNLNAALLYVEHIGSDHMELKTRMRNIEAHYAKLAQEMYASRPVVHMRHDASHQLAEHGDMMERSAAGVYHDASQQVENQNQVKNISFHGIATDAEKGK